MKIKLRIFLWAVLAGAVGWLLFMGVAPSGRISYVYDFENSSYFIRKLTPAERVKLPENDEQEITGSPVYFFLKTPRRFDKAVLTLVYRDKEANLPIGSIASLSASHPIIEAGVLLNKNLWRYDLKPVENRIIDQLSLVWNKTEKNGITFLQREKKYETIEDFLNNISSAQISANQRSEIALYNYNLDFEYLMPDYKLAGKETEINYPLRGDYQFYAYLKNEDLDFTFSFEDLNKNKGGDPVDLNLYYKNKLIDSWRLDDDGIVSDSGKRSAREELNLKNSSLPEGVYKIEVRASDDIITDKIKTKQNKISFINKIWPADAGKENFSIFTDAKNLSAQTINPAKLQKIKIGESELTINKTYSQFNVDISSTTSEIKLEKDDVILAGDGVFAFSEESLINPDIKKVNENFDAGGEGINYILARYVSPREENGWKIAKAEFDLIGAYREDGAYNFMISVPSLKADDGIDDGVELDEIKVELERMSLWEKIKRLLYENLKIKNQNGK